MGSFLLLAVIAGFLALDHRAGWHSLLAHPVFTSLLVGGVLGEPVASLAVGGSLELVYLAIVPMRGAKLPDQVAAGVIGAGITALLIRHGAGVSMPFVSAAGVFLGLLAGEAAARIVAPLLSIHNRVLGAIEFPMDADARALGRRLDRIHTGSLAYLFAVESLTVLLLAPAGYFFAQRFIRVIRPSVAEGVSTWSALLPALFAVSVVHLFWPHRFRLVAAISAAVSVVVLWLA
jgi:mannose/fructose/N-acetylgalactosamine-specific phosphotransferase system component IIC